MKQKFKFKVGDRVFSKVPSLFFGHSGFIVSNRVSEKYLIYDVTIEVPHSKYHTAHFRTFFFGEHELTKRKPRSSK